MSNAYHEHLDRCSHCRVHPFGLCPEGDRTLREAALGEIGRAMTEPIQNPVHQALHVGCGAIAIGALSEELEELTRGIA